MENGAGRIPTPSFRCREVSGVCVALVSQVQRLLQRAAGRLLVFAHLNHVLPPSGLSL